MGRQAREERCVAVIDDTGLTEQQRKIAEFCAEKPRSRSELAELLGAQAAYVMRRYVNPMVESGMLVLSLPETPRSSRQRFTTADRLVIRRP